MAVETDPSTPHQQPVPLVNDANIAPFVFFDEAPNFGAGNGIVNVTIAAYRNLPDGAGGIATDLVIVGHLRCSILGAAALRNALEKGLLIAAPTTGQAH